MKHQTKKAQYGRSMTEMIGVLAIIGLLSIGSVTAYEQGMTQYIAGSLRDSLLKARTLAKTSTSSATAAEVRRFLQNDITRYGVAVSSQSDGYNRAYTVDIGHITPRICRTLFSKANTLEAQGVNITQPQAAEGCNQTTGTSETVKMSFSFSSN